MREPEQISVEFQLAHSATLPDDGPPLAASSSAVAAAVPTAADVAARPASVAFCAPGRRLEHGPGSQPWPLVAAGKEGTRLVPDESSQIIEISN